MATRPADYREGMVVVESWGWLCRRCLHRWAPRQVGACPRRCPRCRSRAWNEPAPKAPDGGLTEAGLLALVLTMDAGVRAGAIPTFASAEEMKAHMLREKEAG